jgi:hypothetical protein
MSPSEAAAPKQPTVAVSASDCQYSKPSRAELEVQTCLHDGCLEYRVKIGPSQIKVLLDS